MAQQLILNKTRGTILHTAPQWALTSRQQAWGFLFQHPGDKCIVFLFMPARRVSFHMWFVFGSIDIMALDGKGKIIALKERFLPWTLWVPNIIASAVLELPTGTIAKSKTKLGDIVVLPAPRK